MGILVYGIHKVLLTQNGSLAQSCKHWKILIYKIFKDTFETSSYIKQLPHFLCRTFMAFRTRNHRFPVELGRWYGKPLNERICHFCNSDLGDKYHNFLACSKFDMERKQYLKPYYYKRPNVLKYHEIVNAKKKKKKGRKKLCWKIYVALLSFFYFIEKCTPRNVAKKAYCKVCIIMNVYVHWITLSYCFHISIQCMLLVR